MTTYTLHLEVRSPVHIGSGGAALKENIDYVAGNVRGRTWTYVLFAERVLDAVLPDPQADPELFEKVLNSRNLASFLELKDLDQDDSLYRYRTRGQSSLTEVRPYVAAADGRPYIPGSSFKGALRTVWVRSEFARSNKQLAEHELGRRREWAFRDIEQQIMSGQHSGPRAPNYDLFRAIQVADSVPIAAAGNSTIANTRVWPAGPKGIPIAVEALDEKATLSLRIKFDDYLLEQQAAALGWQGKAERVRTELWRICREQGRERINQERAWWAGHPQASSMAGFYTRLADDAACDEHFFIELGWGTGWQSKTIGNVIQDKRTLAKIIERYNLTRGNFNPERSFPKTRNVLVDRDQPTMPMGWVKVTVAE